MEPNKENKTEKKTKWSVTDLFSKEKIDFQPIWQEKEEQNTAGLENPTEAKKEIECAFIEVSVKAADGQVIKLKFNYLDLYGFIYFIGNEELRRQLALRYEREIVYVPYDVTIKLDKKERKSGMARRRVELQLDEVAMAMVRARAQLLSGENPSVTKEQLDIWRKKKISNLTDQIKETYAPGEKKETEIDLLTK